MRSIRTTLTRGLAGVRGSVEAHGLSAVGLGLALGYVVTATAGLHVWSLGLVLVVAVVLSKWQRLGEEGVQVPVVALLVLLLAEEPRLYAGQLLAEGVIGGLVAAAVNIVVIPPLQVRAAERALVTLRHRLGDLVDDMSSEVGGDWPPEEQRWIDRARELDGPLQDAREAVRTGDESTRFNPRGRRFGHVPPSQRQTFESWRTSPSPSGTSPPRCRRPPTPVIPCCTSTSCSGPRWPGRSGRWPRP
ncbi:hypothetical protein [Blastococcus montanus]|uniref:hypothetical protein n=1 Tax=Blastococcus montanus TaxID=3144973 RepID=UPI003209BCC8